jgi:acetylserotonin N-methyltransferase
MNPSTVLDLIEAYRRSRTMFAAAKLGVFDAAPLTASSFAASADLDLTATTLLLDGCVSLGLLTRDGDVYSLTPDSAVYLRSDSPQTLIGYILYSHDVLWQLWAHLDDAVREGTHRWKQSFGFDGPIFSHFFRTEESMRTFMRGMHGMGMLSSPKIVAALDLSPYRRMVDLGGGTGHLALSFLDRYPGTTAAVFDLERVVRLCEEFTAGRVECIAGDFFTDPLPAADCYALSRILHDWSEEKIGRLLRKICEALPEGGGVLICEALIDEDRRGPVRSLMQSLSMLTCTEGRERTASEYEQLCKQAGFGAVHAAKTDSPLDALLAIK